MLPKVSSCSEITYISLAHTDIHTSQIHAYVCVSSICLYLPHRPHILDRTNRVLSCLLPCLFSTYGILCFKNVLHIVQYRQRVGVRQGACECERGRAKNSKALLQILCRIPLYNKEIRFSLEHIHVFQNIVHVFPLHNNRKIWIILLADKVKWTFLIYLDICYHIIYLHFS